MPPPRSNSGRYILVEHEAVPCDDLMEWGRAFEDRDVRRVAHAEMTIDGVNGQPSYEVEVSTVFLGIDHNFGGGEPILFETMVFGGPANEYMMRYSTWDEAVVGHNLVLAWVRAGSLEVPPYAEAEGADGPYPTVAGVPARTWYERIMGDDEI